MNITFFINFISENVSKTDYRTRKTKVSNCQKPRAIDENLECLICWNEFEREIVDLNCSCFRHRLCHVCAYLAFETPGIDIVIDYLN